MMKYMMIMVAIMFYKVAAGLALYFIIGSAWVDRAAAHSESE